MIPYALLVGGLLARLPRRTLALVGGLVLLSVAHDVLVYVPRETEAGFQRALHPVNALLLFWIAVHLVRCTPALLRGRSGDRRGI